MNIYKLVLTLDNQRGSGVNSEQNEIAVACCLVTQSCLTLCDSMDCSTPGLPPSPSPEVCPSSRPLRQWCHPSIASCDTPFSSCPQSLPAPGAFPMSWLFTSGDQNTVASVSASVLPMSVQGWFPLRLTGLIFLLPKGLSGVFSSTTVQKHQFFGTLPSLPSRWLRLDQWLRLIFKEETNLELDLKDK